jgi:hypothetical protein
VSDESTISVRRRPDGTVEQLLPGGARRVLESQTDWAKVEDMTEEEIEADALADPDNPPLTDEQLRHLRRVSGRKAVVKTPAD